MFGRENDLDFGRPAHDMVRPVRVCACVVGSVNVYGCGVRVRVREPWSPS